MIVRFPPSFMGGMPCDSDEARCVIGSECLHLQLAVRSRHYQTFLLSPPYFPSTHHHTAAPHPRPMISQFPSPCYHPCSHLFLRAEDAQVPAADDLTGPDLEGQRTAALIRAVKDPSVTDQAPGVVAPKRSSRSAVQARLTLMITWRKSHPDHYLEISV